jgi:hypothetical protein
MVLFAVIAWLLFNLFVVAMFVQFGRTRRFHLAVSRKGPVRRDLSTATSVGGSPTTADQARSSDITANR